MQDITDDYIVDTIFDDFFNDRTPSGDLLNAAKERGIETEIIKLVATAFSDIGAEDDDPYPPSFH